MRLPDAGEQAAQQLVRPFDLDGVAQRCGGQAVGGGEQQQRGRGLAGSEQVVALGAGGQFGGHRQRRDLVGPHDV